MTGTDTWTRPAWLAEARAWIEARLDERQLVVAGRLRDAYLEPWAGTASRAELATAADLARRTGTIQRPKWYLVSRSMPPKVRGARWLRAVRLKLHLADAPFGAWEPEP